MQATAQGGQHQATDLPLHTVTTLARHGLVTVEIDGSTYVVTDIGMRMLQPRELYRAQGFPDDYTAISYRGKPAADGPRYKALGNSWAVNCARWIGRRIQIVEQIHAARKDAAGAKWKAGQWAEVE